MKDNNDSVTPETPQGCRECGETRHHNTTAEGLCPLVPTALWGRKSPVLDSERLPRIQRHEYQPFNVNRDIGRCYRWIEVLGAICGQPRSADIHAVEPPLTDAEVDAFLEAHKNDPVDEARGARVEWLFREKLAADARNAAQEWLVEYEILTSGARSGNEVRLLYSGTKSLIANMARVIETLAINPDAPPKDSGRTAQATTESLDRQRNVLADKSCFRCKPYQDCDPDCEFCSKRIAQGMDCIHNGEIVSQDSPVTVEAPERIRLCKHSPQHLWMEWHDRSGVPFVEYVRPDSVWDEVERIVNSFSREIRKKDLLQVLSAARNESVAELERRKAGKNG